MKLHVTLGKLECIGHIIAGQALVPVALLQLLIVTVELLCHIIAFTWFHGEPENFNCSSKLLYMAGNQSAATLKADTIINYKQNMWKSSIQIKKLLQKAFVHEIVKDRSETSFSLTVETMRHSSRTASKNMLVYIKFFLINIFLVNAHHRGSLVHGPEMF